MAVDSQPKLRSVVERTLGQANADLALGLGNAVVAGLGQSVAGLMVDATLRFTQVREAEQRRRVWQEREPDLLGTGQRAAAEPVVPERPRPLPPGPYERHARWASFASAAGLAAGTVAGTPRRGIGFAVGALPRPARIGREAHAAALGYELARRGVLVLQPGVLRVLDRVDTVVLDPQALSNGRMAMGSVVGLQGASEDEARLCVHRLFRAGSVDECRADGGWTLGPVDALQLSGRRGVRERHRARARGRSARAGPRARETPHGCRGGGGRAGSGNGKSGRGGSAGRSHGRAGARCCGAAARGRVGRDDAGRGRLGRSWGGRARAGVPRPADAGRVPATRHGAGAAGGGCRGGAGFQPPGGPGSGRRRRGRRRARRRPGLGGAHPRGYRPRCRGADHRRRRVGPTGRGDGGTALAGRCRRERAGRAEPARWPGEPARQPRPSRCGGAGAGAGDRGCPQSGEPTGGSTGRRAPVARDAARERACRVGQRPRRSHRAGSRPAAGGGRRRGPRPPVSCALSSRNCRTR